MPRVSVRPSVYVQWIGLGRASAPAHPYVERTSPNSTAHARTFGIFGYAQPYGSRTRGGMPRQIVLDHQAHPEDTPVASGPIL